MTTLVKERVDTLRYLPMPEEIAKRARESLQDGFGHRLHVVTTTAPCRVCLRIATIPERYILLSYRPLPDANPYAEIGPVFVHAERCGPYCETATFPADFLARRLVLRGYDCEGQIVDALVAEPGTAPDRAAALLGDERVAEIHVRHESYTCFDFKIVRST